MDYSKYTLQELQESLSSIDKDAYPQRYEELLSEINARADEWDNFDKAQKQALRLTVNSRLNILSWLQIATSVAFVYVGITTLLDQFSLINLAVFIATSTLNGVAGYLLLKRVKLGYHLTFLNQVAQLLSFNLGFIYYSYAGLGHLAIVLQNGIALKASILSPSFYILFGENLGLGASLDLVALFFIYLLYSCKDEPEIWNNH